MIALPKTASNHHIAHKSISVGEQDVQRGTFPSWLTHQLRQEVICHTLQEPPVLFPLCCIVFPADIRQTPTTISALLAFPLILTHRHSTCLWTVQTLHVSGTLTCANSLAILTWKDGEGPTVDEAASQLREYEESISSSLVSAVEKLSRKVQRLKEDTSYIPPVQTSISAIRSQRSSAQERGYRGYTPQCTLWFYLRDHGENMRK
ncbi:hypothetical protein QYF61_004286 [Mycteria americana]|uniref:Uncharacterized protein n=1 Tax=Mycteria americana TaxID=33587 RepID=A0AAN7MSH9_MYCAM|nr:hypothetical protein QYF61_004286 [Mycteria americana]